MHRWWLSICDPWKAWELWFLQLPRCCWGASHHSWGHIRAELWWSVPLCTTRCCGMLGDCEEGVLWWVFWRCGWMPLHIWHKVSDCRSGEWGTMWVDRMQQCWSCNSFMMSIWKDQPWNDSIDVNNPCDVLCWKLIRTQWNPFGCLMISCSYFFT